MLTRDLFAVANLLAKFIGSLASFRYLQRLYTRTSMRQVQSYNQVVTNAAAVVMATSSLSRDGCELCSERLNGIRQRSNWQWCCDVGPCRGREICRRVDVLLTDVIRSWRQRSSHLLLRGELERTMEIAGLAEWRNKQRGWRNDRIWRKAVEPFEVRRLFAFSPFRPVLSFFQLRCAPSLSNPEFSALWTGTKSSSHHEQHWHIDDWFVRTCHGVIASSAWRSVVTRKPHLHFGL